MNALLVIKPGPLRDGLDALLSSIPDVQLVAHPTNTNAVLDFCQKNPNTLIIMEIKPGDRALLADVPEMKVICHNSQVIALIHDEDDRGAAEQAGMDLVVDVAIGAPELKEIIKDVGRKLPTSDTHDSQRSLG